VVVLYAGVFHELYGFAPELDEGARGSQAMVLVAELLQAFTGSLVAQEKKKNLLAHPSGKDD